MHRGFELAQLDEETPPADVLEEKVGVGLGLLLANSGEQTREDVDLRTEYGFRWPSSDA